MMEQTVILRLNTKKVLWFLHTLFTTKWLFQWFSTTLYRQALEAIVLETCLKLTIHKQGHEWLPIIPGRSIVAFSWMPIPFLIILSDPSLFAPEHVTNYWKSKCNWLEVNRKKFYDCNICSLKNVRVPKHRQGLPE